jgi:Ni/Co efflux regulator RcnB
MKTILALAVAMTVLGTSAALAQYNSNTNRDRGGSGQQQTEPQNRNNQNTNQRDQNGYQGGSQEQGRNDNQGDRYQSQGQNEVRDNPHFSRGDKLSGEYRNNNHVVSDWKGNHLRQPPRGYHWVQANNQYVLAAIASGVISDIMMNNQRDQRAR